MGKPQTGRLSERFLALRRPTTAAELFRAALFNWAVVFGIVLPVCGLGSPPPAGSPLMPLVASWTVIAAVLFLACVLSWKSSAQLHERTTAEIAALVDKIPAEDVLFESLDARSSLRSAALGGFGVARLRVGLLVTRGNLWILPASSTSWLVPIRVPRPGFVAALTQGAFVPPPPPTWWWRSSAPALVQVVLEEEPATNAEGSAVVVFAEKWAMRKHKLCVYDADAGAFLVAVRQARGRGGPE